MHARTLYTMIAIVLLALTGCKAAVKSQTHGTDTVIIDKSPVSGKELNKPDNAQLELNKNLLAKCVVPLPAPPKKGTSKTLAEAKKIETGLYYSCAYLHNALVDFLNVHLGIRPDESTPPAKK